MSNALKVSKSPEFKERRERNRNAPSFRSRKGEKLVDGLSKGELVKKYETKVRMIASRMAQNLPVSVDVNDLVSVGFIGLMDAADKFNVSKGVKFATYAEFRIRGAILDELRNQDWVPHCARGKAKEIERTYHKLERKEGRAPTEAEVSKEMGVSRERLQKLKERVGGLTLVSYEEHESMMKEAADKSEESDPFGNVIRKDAKDFLENLFQNNLSDEERIVLSCYYFRGLNLKEISQILNLTESRISQIHTKSIFKLKQKLREDVPNVQSMFALLLEAV